MSAPFYRAFEDRYRGSRELIRSRLEIYAPFLEPLLSQHAQPAAIDIGCGRGEWLELLQSRGFSARGIDLDEGMLQACRERGLDASMADGLATLRASPPESLSLVSAFHVVEHIGFEELQAIVAEALRVLIPGGLLILETPNPENIEVGTATFYLDPSHVKPIPPQLLAFVVEHAGFDRQTVMRLQEATELHGCSPVPLISVLTGVSPDYAVVAQKRAPADVLQASDAAFSREYGLSLPTLAQRYDQHHALAQAQMREAAVSAQVSDQALRKLIAIVETQARQAKASVAVLEARVALLEQQGTQLLARLQGMESHLFNPRRAGVRERLRAVGNFLRHPRPGPVVRRLSRIARMLGIHGPTRAVYVRVRARVLARLRPESVPQSTAPAAPEAPSVRPSTELSDDAHSVWNQLNMHSKKKQGVD
jgi:SAM-dependent methyltransferase